MALRLSCESALSTFLQSVLEDLAAVTGMSSGIFLDFGSELTKIKKKLTRLQDVLGDGERRRLTERSVDQWMDDLKDLVYDIDDIVDEINFERQQLEDAMRSQPTNNDQVSNFSTVHDRSSSIKRRICEIVKRVDDLGEEADYLKLRREVGKWVSQDMPRPETSASIDDSEIYGREEDKERMVSMLLAGDGSNIKRNYDVICIVGMGGLGKTTLAQLVFNDVRVKNFFDVKSWACVSDIFDVTKATKELIDYVATTGFDGVTNLQSLAALQACLESIINGKRFLLVLDDIWTTEEWDKMKAPLNFCAKGSKILVTTRFKKVVDAISSERCYQLGLLDFDQCLPIFKGRAFGSDIDVAVYDHQYLMKLGEDIVKKCGGVPLAVKTVGAMLRGAGKERWEAVLHNELWDLAYENDEVHPALRLSYYYLPGFLKRCFEYFALFPPDYTFRIDELIRMWIAEGLIDAKHSTYDLSEEIGYRYYDDLIGRSLIQEDDRMHDILHHLACIVSSNFFYHENDGTSTLPQSLATARHVSCKNIEMLVESKRLRTLVVERIRDSSSLIKVWSCSMLRVLDFTSGTLLELPSSIGELKHLRYFRLRASSLRELPDSICTLRNLQSLDLHGCGRLQSLPNDMHHLFNLRYLSLRDTSISSLPKLVCDLPNLRVLDVIGCGELTQLPTEIGKLKSLQKLFLESSSIRSVPQSITNVTGLHVLHVHPGSDLPAHIGKLNMLQRLMYYPVGKEKGCGIDELKDLNKLQGRLVIERMENIYSVDAALMADLISKNISALGLIWSRNYNIVDVPGVEIILEALEPHAGLETLNLINYGGRRIPVWMSNLANLTFLEIKDLPLLERVVGIELPSLASLRIFNCTVLMEISMTTPKLKRLAMRECVELKPNALVLLPWDIVAAQLDDLESDCGYLNYFMRQIVESANVSRSKITQLTLEMGSEDNSITCLPTGWQSVFPSMEGLWLRNLPSSNSFKLLPNADQMDNTSNPPSLQLLVLDNCPRLTCLPSDLRSFSTKVLLIRKCPGLVSLEPQELPQRFQSLYISNCKNLRNLPRGLSDFTSLSFLYLHQCPNLELHPDDVLPANLVSFKMHRCPKFEDELEKGDRVDWSSLRRDFYGVLE